MRINKLTLLCLTVAGLQGCAGGKPDTNPALPVIERTTAISPEQVAIENSEFMDEELAASTAKR